MPHIHDKIDFTVEVFVVHKNTVLLRKHDKYKFWLSIGGHIELDEDPNQAAIREVKEEVGIDIKIAGTALNFNAAAGYRELIPPKFLNRHRINDIHEHITMTYFATAGSNETVQGGREVSDELRWFTTEELDSPLYEIRDSIKYYAKSALKELGAR
ncbi:MAG: NUDIX domain-containing protein [Candidatus Liptonbacteria bacterium]|nr:NUDIX domain-containing protein [Candidatus Liptonbacteria bacterium]